MNQKNTESKAAYWQKYYEHQHKQISSEGLAKSVEYSNERVQLQTYVNVIEGVGTAYGKSILDI